jgi:hypothetical protein
MPRGRSKEGSHLNPKDEHHEKSTHYCSACRASLPAFAETLSTPRIDQRQDKQERRIEQGVRTGQLTPREGSAP